MLSAFRLRSLVPKKSGHSSAFRFPHIACSSTLFEVTRVRVCLRRESNPHQGLRTPLLYPLSYEGLRRVYTIAVLGSIQGIASFVSFILSQLCATLVALHMEKKSELHCIVTGRVQGVAFRNFVVSIADDLQLTGFVANLPDGSVEVLAQGDYKILKVFENHLQVGPSGSRVKNVYEEWREPEKEFQGFKKI